MAVVKIGEDHYKEAIQLSMYAFQYELTPEQLESRLEDLDSQTILGIFDDQQLAAKLHIRPFNIFQHGRKLAMAGVAGVSTYPEFRRLGYVKELMAASLRAMKEQGQTVSMLHPFSIDFYRKYGWELFTDYMRVTMNRSQLTIKNAGHGNGMIKRFAKGEYNKILNDVYETYTNQYSGMMQRTKTWWNKNIIKNQTAAVYYSNEGNPEGYILYSIEKNKMEVEEFIVLNQEARAELWQFICQHDSMIEKLEMNLNIDEPLLFTMHNPNVKIEKKPYFMARIVDVEQYMSHFPFIVDDNQKTTIHIDDSFAEWNNGIYEIESGKVKKVFNKSLDNTDLLLSMSINSLTALLFGYMSAETLWHIGKIKGEKKKVEQLDSLIPKQTTYFPDFF